MKLTIKFDDTETARREAGLALVAVAQALNPDIEGGQRALPKPYRVFGSKDPDTVEEAMALITGAGLDERAVQAAEAVLQEYRALGKEGYFLASHLARVILPFFQSPKQP